MNTVKPTLKSRAGTGLALRAWYRDKDGNKVWAKDHGKKAWPPRTPIGK